MNLKLKQYIGVDINHRQTIKTLPANLHNGPIREWILPHLNEQSNWLFQLEDTKNSPGRLFKLKNTWGVFVDQIKSYHHLFVFTVIMPWTVLKKIPRFLCAGYDEMGGWLHHSHAELTTDSSRERTCFIFVFLPDYVPYLLVFSAVEIWLNVHEHLQI